MPEEHVFEFNGEPIYSCPQAMVDEEALDALEMWAWYERGHLPRAGGVDDQLERDLQLIMAIEAVRIEEKEDA